MKIRNMWVALLAALALAACGGGGGGGAPAPEASTQNFNLWQAWVNYVGTPATRSFTISGTISGVAVTGSGTATSGALAAATFEGRTALRMTTVVTGTVAAAGNSAPYSDSTTYYFDSNYLPLGYSGDEYGVVTGSATIPQTGKVNDTGILYSYRRYQTSTKTILLGTTEVSYALLPDTADTALMKVVSTERSPGGVTGSVSTVTLRVTTAGAITRLSEEYQDGTSSLTLRY